jgi:murein DD-endopeptidase MepM/ murein hydrolase activator NlpD
MQLIIVSSPLAQARTISVRFWHILAVTTTILLLFVVGSSLLYYLTFRHAAIIKLPILKDLVLNLSQDETMKQEQFTRENLNAMAVKLGEMQAQLLRMDSLSDRVSGLAGIKPSTLIKQVPGRGGLTTQTQQWTLETLQAELAQTQQRLESRLDELNILESELLGRRLLEKRLPTILPVNATFNSSGFGRRIDPFTGQSAMHEGVDFVAPIGTSVVAAAGGVVVAAEFHPQYGNVIDIDHGGEITSRYAHASRLIAKVGDIVKRGQKIAEVGSTGRSTGAHLHFEVRVRDVAQNPVKFLGNTHADEAFADAGSKQIAAH